MYQSFGHGKILISRQVQGLKTNLKSSMLDVFIQKSNLNFKNYNYWIQHLCECDKKQHQANQMGSKSVNCSSLITVALNFYREYAASSGWILFHNSG